MYKITIGLASFVFIAMMPISAKDMKIEDVFIDMNQANDLYDYQGEVVTYSDDQVQAFKIQNKSSEEESVYQSVEALNGMPRKIIREENSLYCYFPGKKKVVKDNWGAGGSVVNSLFSSYAEHLNPKSVESYYQIRLLADDSIQRVADREAILLELIPNDEFRYKQKIYLDKETSLLLKLEVFDEGGNVMRSQMFTSIDYGDFAVEAHPLNIEDKVKGWDVVDFSVDDRMLEDADQYTSIDSESIKIKGINCDIPSEYQGYKYQNSIARHNEMSDMTEQYNFSDGLFSFSVFVAEVSDENKMDNVFLKKGAINNYMKVLNNKQMVLMGEVPKSLLMGFSKVFECGKG